MISFYSYFPATLRTALQHPCRFLHPAYFSTVKKSFVHKLCRLTMAGTFFVAGSLFLAGSAYAALNCTEQPSCSSLGYTTSISSSCPSDKILSCPYDSSYKKCVLPSCDDMGFTTTDKSSWCGQIINCASNTAYTACVAEKSNDCSTYNYTSCPSVALKCSTCINGSTIKYRIESCVDGFTYSNYNCTGNLCSGYNLSSCPTGGICSTCKSGYTTKYKLDGCKANYVLTNGTCYDCATKYSQINTRAKVAQNSYRRCTETTGVTTCTKCRTSCSDTTSRGSYYAASCFNLIGAPGGSGDSYVCIDALQTVKDEVAAHNALACPSNYRVTENINPTTQCNQQIECGFAVTFKP